MAKIRIIIIDGKVDAVLCNDPDVDVDIELVDFEHGLGDSELLEEKYEDGYEDIPYSVDSCKETYRDEYDEEDYQEDYEDDYTGYGYDEDSYD